MKYVFTISLLAFLITNQVIGMEQAGWAESLVMRAGSFAISHPMKTTVIAGLSGATVGKIFNHPSEGFLAGALAFNTTIAAMTNSEIAFDAALNTALLMYLQRHPHANLANPTPETALDVAQIEQTTREGFLQLKRTHYLISGVIISGYIIKKLYKR